MPSPGSKAIDVITDYRKRFGVSGITPSIARLYSQYTRLRTGQGPLPTWTAEEARERLNEALGLMSASFIHSSTTDLTDSGLRRAAEILEWLSHPNMTPTGVPVSLLAAGAYQLAGYPARAASIIASQDQSNYESRILKHLFQGDFQGVHRDITSLWSSLSEPKWDEPLEREETPERDETPERGQSSERDDVGDLTRHIHDNVVFETIRCLGVLNAWLRWGDDARLEMALEKLRSIARLMLHSRNPFSWMSATLCAEVVANYIDNSFRTHLLPLMTEPGVRTVLEQYLRSGFRDNRCLAWPSQVKGIHRLHSTDSFALCTPTGSGKTTIAELALLTGLFRKTSAVGESGHDAPLAMYLVPSRALAAEVEVKLQQAVGSLANHNVVVTGLYGGIDWGPTDAWLTRDKPTVVICTYEKAEALLRFLGPVFLHRLNLVVIDEAHNVRFESSQTNLEQLYQGENRAFRLESLVSRLMAFTSPNKTRIIALSAVMVSGQEILDRWITGSQESEPVEVSYWSTRRLLGRLNCLPHGRTEILYDVLDGHPLKVNRRRPSAEVPYIPNPFPKLSHIPSVYGVEKITLSYALWAAIHLSRADEGNSRQSVLLSIPQTIGRYAATTLDLLDRHWDGTSIPQFFVKPTSIAEGMLYENALASCEDYFGLESYEYRLLTRGIVLHQGGMPPRLSRLLIQLIERRIIRIVLATSTLSEGINLPFDVVLVVSLLRAGRPIPPSEFANLAGRAGRPGHGLEGRCLVVTLDPSMFAEGNRTSSERAIDRYNGFIRSMLPSAESRVSESQSPLFALIDLMRTLYNTRLRRSGITFEQWVERTAPSGDIDSEALLCLDTLDGFLLTVTTELDALQTSGDSELGFEERLRSLWHRTFAYWASNEEDLGDLLITRSKSLVTRFYPDQAQRRQLHKTSLPPRHGTQLLHLYEGICDHLRTGDSYADWTDEERLVFIEGTVRLLRTIQPFRSPHPKRDLPEWPVLLRWWLLPSSTSTPTPDQLSDWYKAVNGEFVYRFNWGLGSVVALALDHLHEGKNRLPDLQDWPNTRLPWIAFWIKELIVWGTLDPVVAYLMSKGIALTRREAELKARDYYSTHRPRLGSDQSLNPVSISLWAAKLEGGRNRSIRRRPPSSIRVEVLVDVDEIPDSSWRVLPIQKDNKIVWMDSAGYALAQCRRPKQWLDSWPQDWDFILHPAEQQVVTTPYGQKTDN